MLSVIFCAIALVLILIGILFEEKLITFEDKIYEHFAYLCACVVVWHRNRKAGKKLWSVTK